jgi:transcriptional regulator with XRE-family HTH domain
MEHEENVGPMDELAALVKKARLGKGMRGIDLAAAIGKDPSYVTKLERTTLKEIPPPETVRALAEALGLSEARLVRAIGYRVGDVAPQDQGPFDKNTWQWVAVTRLRQMDDVQAQDVANYAEYVLTKKQTELPVILRQPTRVP